MIKNLLNNRGMTLVEVLISMLIMTIGLLGVMGMQIIGIRGNVNSRYISEAVAIGEDSVELVKGMDYDNITYSNLNDLDNTDIVPDSTKPNIKYNRYWEVLDGSPIPGSREIKVEITWVDPRVEIDPFTGEPTGNPIIKSITLKTLKWDLSASPY